MKRSEMNRELGGDLLAGGADGDAAQALREEAAHRESAGTFFGHISYVSVISRKAGLDR